MSNQQEIILLNNDKVTLQYALLILSRVFGFDKQEAKDIATQIDRYGSAVVFTGTDSEAQTKLESLKSYNEATGNSLKATVGAAGTHVAPNQQVLTQGHAVTLRLNTFVFPDDHFKYAVHSLISLDKGLDKTINWNWFVPDLQKGKEVIIKEFEGDRAEQKAQMFADALIHLWELDKPESELSDEEKTDNANLLLSVRVPGYALEGPQTLRSAEEMKKAELVGSCSDFVTEIKDQYVKGIEKEYGSVTDFLKDAPADKIKEYHETMDQVQQMADIKATRGKNSSM